VAKPTPGDPRAGWTAPRIAAAIANGDGRPAAGASASGSAGQAATAEAEGMAVGEPAPRAEGSAPAGGSVAPAGGSVAPAGTGARSAPWPGNPVAAPARTVGRLFWNNAAGTPFACTAFTVGSANRDLLLTAGHCIHAGNGGAWHKDFMFVPGLRNGGEPFGRWTPREVWTVDRWTRSGSQSYDVGVLVMNPNARGSHLAEVIGGQGLAINGSNDTAVVDLGYGISTEPSSPQALKYCDGTTGRDWLRPLEITIACDMRHGASGGPLIAGLGSNGIGTVVSLNSHILLPRNPGYMYGPYFGNWMADLYRAVQGRRVPFTAVMGDWDGNGTDTPGVFRNGVWYLRNTNGPGPADVVFSFGLATDKPVVGDWDGNGKDGVGVFRNGAWYLANTPGGPTTSRFNYGLAADKPVTGDWDGNRRDGVGVDRAGTWYLANVPGGPTTRGFAYGAPADMPVTGDWNRDGRATVGVVRVDEWLLADILGGGATTRFRFG